MATYRLSKQKYQSAAQASVQSRRTARNAERKSSQELGLARFVLVGILHRCTGGYKALLTKPHMSYAILFFGMSKDDKKRGLNEIKRKKQHSKVVEFRTLLIQTFREHRHLVLSTLKLDILDRRVK